MKISKKIISTILIFTFIGILFHAWFYRQLFTYKSIGQRQSYVATEGELVRYIENNVDDKDDLCIKSIINLGLSITSKKLNFTASKNHNNPNKLIFSENAHCVGYATFFSLHATTY